MSAPSRPACSDPPADDNHAGLVPHENLLSCIHCGLCTSSCPTYLETGNENDSPRGRIHLMRGIEEKRIPLTQTAERHLDLCLDCRSCETACPSGVQYGQLIETFRLSVKEQRKSDPEQSKEGWFEKYFLRQLFTDRRRLERLLWPARLMQWTRLDRLIDAIGLPRLLPTPLQRMHRMLPRLTSYKNPLPDRLDTKQRPARRRVGLFLGCVADAMYRDLHWATARVLQNAGCDVFVPPTQVCCGAIEFHSGYADEAVARAKRNIDAFPAALVDEVVINVAGCGAMLKEYSHLTNRSPELAEELVQFSQRVRDINEFLASLEFEPPQGALPIRVVYQDACHLRHAQQIDRQPRKLLLMIPELKLLEIKEPNICCGAAGSYNLTEPDMSDRLVERKINHILEQQPDVIASANAGCSLQLKAALKERGLDIPVLHPIELLDASQQGLSIVEYLKDRG